MLRWEMGDEEPTVVLGDCGRGAGNARWRGIVGNATREAAGNARKRRRWQTRDGECERMAEESESGVGERG